MDLWILKQDKTHLKKVIYEIQLGTNGTVLVDCQEFGTYDTDERAAEVFNEIQRCLNGRTIISPRKTIDFKRTKKEFFDSGFIITDGSVDIIPSDVIVYEMPKE